MSRKPKNSNKAAAKAEVTPKTVASNEIPELKPNEVLTPEKDAAVQNAKIQGSVDIPTEKEIIEKADDSKGAKEIINEDKELKKDLEKGDATVASSSVANDLSVLAKPMVPNPIGGKPVYETSLQARLAQAAKGELATPDKKK